MSVDGPKHILIIDADNVRRGMLACSLPTSRYALDFAKTPAAGLDKLKAEVPELILIGHDADSRELCQHLRSLPTLRDCVVMLMDESFRDEAAADTIAEATGADRSIPFPFTAEELETRIQGRSPTAVPGPPPAEPVSLPEVAALATISPSTVQTEPEQAPSEEEAWERFRSRVEGIYEQLAERDYYDLLEVPHQATGGQIKDSYFERSIEFHPDRFMQLDDTALKHQIYEVYKRITEAFKVLLDPHARTEYDQQIAGDGSGRLRYLEFGRTREPAVVSADVATTPASRRYVNFADLAERNGNLKSARMYLTLAAQCEPQNDTLRGRLDEITKKLGR